MKASLDDLILSLVSAVPELKKLTKADEIDRKDEDSAWELLAQIEELFEVFDDRRQDKRAIAS